MTENKLRDYIGIFIIVANILVVGVTIALYFLGGFLFEEVTTTIALIVPMFSVYTTAIIRSIIANRLQSGDSSAKVTASFLFIVWIFPAVFTAYLISLILLKSYNIGFSSFEQFKAFLIASETIFGTYIGVVLSSMFRIRHEARRSDNDTERDVAEQVSQPVESAGG
jgi:membrane protease YdiL (CAAX protease family)